MIYKEDIFNNKSINVFTDASITKIGREFIGCAGMVLINDNNIYDKYEIIRHTTNNNSEIKAIRMAVYELLKYKNSGKILRIFSDSQISIFGIRNRIFNWEECDAGILAGSAGVIKNQEIFLDILYTILNNKLHVEFYHQSGHVKYNEKSLIDARKVFMASNGIREEVDLRAIKELAYYNNWVDVKSRNNFKNVDLYHLPDIIDPIRFYYTPFDKSEYYNLINNKENSGGSYYV